MVTEKQRAYNKAYRAKRSADPMLNETDKAVAKARLAKRYAEYPELRAFDNEAAKARRKKRLAAHPELRMVENAYVLAQRRKRESEHPDIRDNRLAHGRAYARKRWIEDPNIREYSRNRSNKRYAEDMDYRAKRKADANDWRTKNHGYEKTRRAMQRDWWFVSYGDECRDCGEKDRRFLTFAHLKDDGTIDRYVNGPMAWIRHALEHQDPERYGTQCYNCQRIQELKHRDDLLAKRVYADNSKTVQYDRASTRARSNKKRQYGFQALGGAHCNCCGETDQRVLEFAHKNDDGAQERLKSGTRSWFKFISDHPEKYEVLCANCNQGGAHNGGICPHRAERIKATQGQDARSPPIGTGFALDAITTSMSGIQNAPMDQHAWRTPVPAGTTGENLPTYLANL